MITNDYRNNTAIVGCHLSVHSEMNSIDTSLYLKLCTHQL